MRSTLFTDIFIFFISVSLPVPMGPGWAPSCICVIFFQGEELKNATEEDEICVVKASKFVLDLRNRILTRKKNLLRDMDVDIWHSELNWEQNTDVWLAPFLFVFLSLLSCGRPPLKASSEQGSSSDKKERPMSTMSEASNYTGGSDYSTFPGSPATTDNTATTTSTSSTRVSLQPDIL